MPQSTPSRLFLLRHAHSSWALPGQRDHERPLDDRGRREAPLVGAAFQALELPLDRVVASSAVRAQETLGAVRPFLGTTVAFEASDDLYALGPEAYLAAARHSGVGALMLVGHNPMIEEVVTSLVGEGEPYAVETLKLGFPTAGLAVVEFDTPLSAIAPGTGRLVVLLAPRRL